MGDEGEQAPAPQPEPRPTPTPNRDPGDDSQRGGDRKGTEERRR